MARTPSKRELLRPWELLAGALLLSVFVAVIVLAGTRNWTYAAIALGGAFIIALMGLSMFSLAIKPDSDELADIAVLDREQFVAQQRAAAVAEALPSAAPAASPSTEASLAPEPEQSGQLEDSSKPGEPGEPGEPAIERSPISLAQTSPV